MADVKVKIAAENKVKTGLQAALNDVKAFGGEASKAGAPKIGGGEIRKSLKGLGADLATASTPADALQAVITRLAGAFGKVTSVVAGFAIGKIIAGQFDKVTEQVKSATDAATNFGKIFESVAKADTFDGAISGFGQLQSEIDKVGGSIKAINNDWGAWLANAAMLGKPIADLKELKESLEKAQSIALSASLFRQREQAEALVPAAGDKKATEKILLEQKRRTELDALQSKIAASSGDPVALRNAQSDLLGRFAAEDAVRRLEDEKAAAEETAKEVDALNKKRKEAQDQIALDDARLRGDTAAERTLVGQQAFDKAEGLSFEDRSNLAAQAEAKVKEAASTGAKGAAGSSALQRIGFASNEFFDSRGAEASLKETRRAADAAHKIVKLLEKAEPLVLN
jgi:hypothetical protein